MHFSWPLVVMTSIASVNINFFRFKVAQPLGLLYRPVESVSVIRVAVQRFRANYKIIFRRGRNTHLATKLVLLMSFAFGDALHFRCMQAVQLVLVLALLR